MKDPTYTDFIGIYENIVDPSLCKKIIDLYENSDRWSCLPPADRTSNYVQDSQLVIDCFNKELSGGLMEDLKTCLYHYIDTYPLLNSCSFISSTILMQKTKPSQGYHVFHAEDMAWNISSRTMAWMIYLNDVPEGGETEFLYQKKRFKPTEGTIMIWPATYTHMHRGNPPMSEKYIATGWFQSDMGLPSYKVFENK